MQGKYQKKHLRHLFHQKLMKVIFQKNGVDYQTLLSDKQNGKKLLKKLFNQQEKLLAQRTKAAAISTIKMKKILMRFYFINYQTVKLKIWRLTIFKHN